MVEHAELGQRRGLVPVDVLVRDLGSPEADDRRRGDLNRRPVTGTFGSIQSIGIECVKRSTNSSTR